MALTALDERNESIYAADIVDPSGTFHCKYCSESLTFINAQQKNKHFRHQPHCGCSNSVRGWEPETREHEEHKAVILDTIQRLALITPAAKGMIQPEYPVGEFRPDIYWVPEVHNLMFAGIAFEVQASNYDINTYMEKIRYYRNKNIYTVYLFLANNSPFMAETRTYIFSLKAIERILIAQTAFKSHVYAAHMDQNNIYDCLWQRKFARGGGGSTNDTLFVTVPKPISKHAMLNRPSHHLSTFLMKILDIASGRCQHERYHYDTGLQYLPRRCFDCGKVLDYRSRLHPGIAHLRNPMHHPMRVYKNETIEKYLCQQWSGHETKWGTDSPVSFLPAYRATELVYKVFCSRCGHYYQTLTSDTWKAMGLPEAHDKNLSRKRPASRRESDADHIDTYCDECAGETNKIEENQSHHGHSGSMQQLSLPYPQEIAKTNGHIKKRENLGDEKRQPRPGHLF